MSHSAISVNRSFDPSIVDSKWNEAELSDFWMCEMLKAHGWSTTRNSHCYFRKEVKSSFRDRVDIVLYIGNRIVACVELKKPQYSFSNLEKKSVSLKQASKYALSKYKEHHGAVVSPLGVLTNGKTAFLFDGSLRYEQVLSFHKELDLSTREGLKEFVDSLKLSAFNQENCYSLSPVLKIPYQKCNKPLATSADAQLSKDILTLYKKIHDHPGVPDKEVAFLATISLFILSVFRDCGLYPNARIVELLKLRSRDSWRAMIDDLSTILNSDLSILKSKYCEQGWDFYENTSWFCVNLASFPATGLGRAYEDLLEHISQNSTSYFTPDHIIQEIVQKLNIRAGDKVLDPTCGSASFLASIADKLINESDMDLEQSKKYIEEKLHGVDKDWFAVQIAKMSIIAVYAKNIQFEDENANKFRAPKINVTHCNFFDYSDPQKFDVVVGNPPWGSIDKELEDAYQERIKKYKSYSDKTDICVYIVEQAWRKLVPNGRFGLLCKRDILEGSKHSNHRKIWNKYVDEVWDYGRRHLFHNNPALTMILLGTARDKELEYKIIPKDSTAEKKSFNYVGVPLSTMFDCYKGFESGADDIYRLVAKKYPNDGRTVPEVNDRNIDPYYVNTEDQIYFMTTNDKFPERVKKYLAKEEIVKTLRKSKNRKKSGKDMKGKALWFLYQRENCLRNNTRYDGWSFIYRAGKNSNSIVIPRFIRGERCRAALIESDCATMASLSVLTPVKISKANLYYTLAFLNSEAALNVIMNSVKMADAGKVAAFPEYLEKIKVPACPDSAVKEAIIKISFYLSKYQLPDHIKEDYISSLDKIFEQLIDGKGNDSKLMKNEALNLERVVKLITQQKLKIISEYKKLLSERPATNIKKKKATG